MNDKKLVEEYRNIKRQIDELQKKVDVVLKASRLLTVMMVGSASGRGYGEELTVDQFTMELNNVDLEDPEFDYFDNQAFSEFITILESLQNDIDIVKISYNLIDFGAGGSMWGRDDEPDIRNGEMIDSIDEIIKTFKDIKNSKTYDQWREIF